MSDAKYLRDPSIVARCEKCGRAYVWVNPDNPRPTCLVHGCDGTIRLLEELEATDNGRGN
jgi:hypothetical protein